MVFKGQFLGISAADEPELIAEIDDVYREYDYGAKQLPEIAGVITVYEGDGGPAVDEAVEALIQQFGADAVAQSSSPTRDAEQTGVAVGAEQSPAEQVQRVLVADGGWLTPTEITASAPLVKETVESGLKELRHQQYVDRVPAPYRTPDDYAYRLRWCGVAALDGVTISYPTFKAWSGDEKPNLERRPLHKQHDRETQFYRAMRVVEGFDTGEGVDLTAVDTASFEGFELAGAAGSYTTNHEPPLFEEVDPDGEEDRTASGDVFRLSDVGRELLRHTRWFQAASLVELPFDDPPAWVREAERALAEWDGSDGVETEHSLPPEDFKVSGTGD